MNREIGNPQDTTASPGGPSVQPKQSLDENLSPFAAAASERVTSVRLFQRRRINLLVWGSACVLGAGMWVMLFKLL